MINKFYYIAIVILTITLVGCGVTGLVNNALEANPDARFYVIDDDHDTVPDAVGYLDGDGDPVTDSNGNPIELAGSREKFNEDKEADANISSLLLLISGLGVPGAGWVGKKWGQAKVITRADGLNTTLKNVVKSVDAVRKLDFSNYDHSEILPAINKALKDTQSLTEGVEAAVAAIKAEIKAEERK